MESILLLLHTGEGGELPKLAMEALAVARKTACDINESTFSVGVVGGDIQPAANAIAGCGAGRFLGVAGEEFVVSRYSTDAAAAEALCRIAGATLVVAPGTSRWNRCLPGVAQRVGGVMD